MSLRWIRAWFNLAILGMENLSRYNCVPIENERRQKQLLMSEHQKFDRTDSDATSGIGLELAPLSNCSSESDKCSGTFQEWLFLACKSVSHPFTWKTKFLRSRRPDNCALSSPNSMFVYQIRLGYKYHRENLLFSVLLDFRRFKFYQSIELIGRNRSLS